MQITAVLKIGTYRNLGHAKILISVGLLSGAVGGIAVGRCVLVGKVVDHLSVELLHGLGLTTTSVATLATSAGGTVTATRSGGRLCGSGRLRLGLLTIKV